MGCATCVTVGSYGLKGMRGADLIGYITVVFLTSPLNNAFIQTQTLYTGISLHHDTACTDGHEDTKNIQLHEPCFSMCAKIETREVYYKSLGLSA